MDIRLYYKEVCRWYAIAPPVFAVVISFINAPFGRFSLSNDARFQFDGIKSWIVMELVAPLTFVVAYLRTPLGNSRSNPTSLEHPQAILALLFLVHYSNRALISPMRTPSRSKAHAIVTFCGIFFNAINGALMGSYLSSHYARAFLAKAFQRKSFWAGLALWALGFTGNIVHDEILLNIRRNAKKKSENGKEHYAIPYGYLYRYISYPNYFCEWLEWLGFAIAAAPVLLGWRFFTKAAPPWLFFMSEVWLMTPRAVRGHQWYHQNFPDYPKDRKAVVPFVL